MKLAEDRQGNFYAVKIMSKQGLINENQTDHVHNEKQIMFGIDGPFFVQTYGFFQDSRCIYFV